MITGFLCQQVIAGRCRLSTMIPEMNASHRLDVFWHPPWFANAHLCCPPKTVDLSRAPWRLRFPHRLPDAVRPSQFRRLDPLCRKPSVALEMQLVPGTPLPPTPTVILPATKIHPDLAFCALKEESPIYAMAAQRRCWNCGGTKCWDRLIEDPQLETCGREEGCLLDVEPAIAPDKTLTASPQTTPRPHADRRYETTSPDRGAPIAPPLSRAIQLCARRQCRAINGNQRYLSACCYE